ncbi:MAG: transglycosylase domain-containing protein [Acidobacteriota bacterium]
MLGVSVVGLGALFALAFSRAELDAPAATRLVLDRQGEFLGEVSADPDRGHGFWPVDSLPERVVAATVAVEDRRFWSHPGVDPRSIARALWQNLSTGERVSGASTLAMQVARLQHPGPRTYARKLLEAATAVCLTARHGREAVLRQYLRLVPYGNQLHGIGYAARRYLDKPIDDLSWAEIAFLAAIPQAPSQADPFDPRGRARAVRRGLFILDLLHEEGVLEAAEYRQAQRQIRRLRIPRRAHRPLEAMHAVLRYDDLLRREARAGDALAEERTDIIVRTTLDLELQRDLAARLERRVDAWRQRGAGQAALLVLDRHAGFAVRAAIGSAGWDDARHAGAIDYLRVPRSPGSALKPFVYARALDRGLLTPASIVDDLGRGAGGITNADGRYLGPLTPRSALANSRNVPAAELVERLGVDDLWSLFDSLGLLEHAAADGPRRYGLGVVLGSLPVTVDHLARAYTALADGGLLHQPRWREDRPPVPPRRVLSEDAARQVALFLADPQARLPSFPRLGATEYPYPVAVKTGTSSRYRDAWTVAWSARWLVVAWVGHHDHRPMAGLSGYRAAALLVHDAMTRLDDDPARGQGLAELSLPPPRGHRAVPLCMLSGARAGAACDRASTEWLAVDEAARLEPCAVHRHVAVDRRNGLLARAATPPEAVEVRAVAALPPRYAAWAVAAGLPLAPTAESRLGAVSTPGVGGSSTFAVRSSVLGPASPPLRAVARGGPTTVRIVAPRGAQRLYLDPEAPPGRSTVALRAVVDPPTPQLLWRVDGAPWRLVDHPYETRWPLTAGDHRIEAEIPLTGVRSAPLLLRVE